jgi:2-methylcitrate dehydratase PrpD
MTTLESLAELVQGFDSARLSPDAIDKLKRHLLDTLGAMLAGTRTDEGIAIGKLLDQGTDPNGIWVPVWCAGRFGYRRPPRLGGGTLDRNG